MSEEIKDKNFQNRYFRAVVLSLACLVAVFLPFHKAVETELDARVLGESTESPQLPVAREIHAPVFKKDSASLQLQAASAIAVDVRTKKVLFEKSPDLEWPTASLAKLMTALVVYNITPLDTVVTVKQGDTKVVQPVMGLAEGERIKVLDLLKGMLIMSANDAATTLAASLTGSPARFVEMMNMLAKKKGLENTRFLNPVGFDEQGQYSTAADLANLTYEFLSNKIFADIVQTQAEKVAAVDGSKIHYLRTSNKLLERDDILGVKTGYTEAARGNLILLAADKYDNQIITVLLGSEDRENESLKLVNWVFRSFEFGNSKN